MTVPDTTLLDRYRIERELGTGGMATVYLAHDVRHDRKVALKMLRPELAAVIGGARFLAEIRTTANLQHPHILALYDSGETAGSVFYVMPFVAGESLRDRLRREKQLPVDEAVRIAGEVADALEYAHRQGIVHRDIKPENILLHDGRALVADFGISLAVSLSDSSTRMTETGVSLGTPHYMSPEQAMGERELTARSDVYALGCVLYEMLTGEPPFTGPTAQAIVARVMTEAPRSITAQRHTVPSHVEAAVRRALEKLPADRFGNAAQFAEALRHPAVTPASLPVDFQPRRQPSLVLPLGVALAVAMAMAAWGWLRPPEEAPVSSYALQFPARATPLGMMHLSRDGALLVYGSVAGEQPAFGLGAELGAQLWVKQRDRVDPIPVPNSVGVGVFALSPDARSIAYVESSQPGAPGLLRRFPVSGGPRVTIADSAAPFGVAWLNGGTMVFSKRVSKGYALWKVAESGGVAEEIWAPDSTGALALPNPLPDGRGVLVTRYGLAAGPPAVWLIDVTSGTASVLIEGALAAQYAPSGHLLYVRGDGGLYAVPFKPGATTVTGSPIPLMDGVEITFGLLPQFTIALDGTLVVRSGRIGSYTQFQPVWVDRTGRQAPIDTAFSVNIFTQSKNVGWSLSPDESQLAIGISANGNDDIWIKQLPAGPATRVTLDSASDVRPRWTPDGRGITFISARTGFNQQLFQTSADGSGRDSLLLQLPAPIFEGEWTRDGSWLLARIGDETTNSRDIVAVRPGIDSPIRPVAAAPGFNESAPAVSPDAKWVAYESTESGRIEIFIRPFPDTDRGKWQVSTSGGFAPLWSRDGRELFYVNTRREMMAMPFTAGSPPRLGARRKLFAIPNDMYGGVPEYYTPHDVARDGRFVMMRRVREDSLSTRVLVIENVTREIRDRSRLR